MTVESADDLADQIKEALRLVIDPELGYNIVDLGLIYDIAVGEGGAAHVLMTTTTRGCPATDYLQSGARHRIEDVPGINSVDVQLTYNPPWSPHMMSPDAKSFLGVADGDGR